MQITYLGNKSTQILGRIFQHPAPHNLEWHYVIALVEHLGTVVEEKNGHLIFTINGVSQGVHRSSEKDVSSIEQVMEIRRFLESAGIGKTGVMKTEQVETDTKLRLLVVINQKSTLVFRSEGKSEGKDAVPERLYPYDPHGELHHLDHTRGDDIESRAPENVLYYEAISKTLTGAGEILMMGNGTGASSAMTHLKDYLVTHHPQIANAIVGTLTVDLEAHTEAELLQEARSFYQLRDGSSDQ